jgi:DNA modification methylase
MQPVIMVGGAAVFHGSNLDVLPTLPANSVDSIVTDPPYELGFMGKSWDSTGIAYSVELWRECLRVLKPGGHILAFGGSRTWHRLAVAIEDAGFEMRDSIAWLYGSGFPKSHDISKALDKAAGVEREVIGQTKLTGSAKMVGGKNPDGIFTDKTTAILREFADITTPATPEAIKWQGWGTALKPAFEPVVVGRKPLIGTVAANVLEWGVGGLNIDGSRIGRREGDVSAAGNRTATFGTQETESGGDGSGGWEQNDGGRWPANIILDEYTAELLDEQSGQTGGGSRQIGAAPRTNIGHKLSNSSADRNEALVNYGDKGGVSRFFYVAKASKRDRNEGLEGLPTLNRYQAGGVGGTGGKRDVEVAINATPVANFHPTVKPTDLMRYLIKLVTPAGGVVLDPFTGSGSTGKAALLDGYQFIGIELTAEYLPIIEGRLQWADTQHNQTEAEQANKENETLF